MGTRPRPYQAALAAAGRDWAREARTGPRPMQTRCDTPSNAIPTLIAGSLRLFRQTKSQDDRANVILLILPGKSCGNISDITLARSSLDFFCLETT